MAVTVQMQFESVVTEIYQDAFVGSSIGNGTTVIQFDLRPAQLSTGAGDTGHALLAQGILPRRCA